MKKTGNTCDFAEERDAALMAAYRRELRESDHVSLDSISEGVARRPCSRFWVSEERAVSVVSAMLRGINITERMHASKRRMYDEIYRRFLIVRSRRPTASLVSAVAEVIYTEAPEFYLSPRYVRDRIILNRSKSAKSWNMRG